MQKSVPELYEEAADALRKALALDLKADASEVIKLCLYGLDCLTEASALSPLSTQQYGLQRQLVALQCEAQTGRKPTFSRSGLWSTLKSKASA